MGEPLANQRAQRIARVVDREVAPVWHDRFARIMFRNLPMRAGAVVLDVHCGTGRTTTELLTRLDETARIVALDPNEASLSLARARMRPEWRKRVYFKTADVGDVTSMANDSYDLAVANLVLSEAHDWASVVEELVRVTRPGGEVLATLPLSGSWSEIEDIFYEVLLHEGQAQASVRLSRLAQLRPTGPSIAAGLLKLGLSEEHFVIEQERFCLLFPSGREFLFSPAVEHGPLRLWKGILGEDARPQELFWRLKEALDLYYQRTAVSITIAAGLVRIQVPGPGVAPVAPTYWRRYPNLDAIFSRPADPANMDPPGSSATPVADSGEHDFDVDLDVDEEAATVPAVRGDQASRDVPAAEPASTPSTGLLDDEDIFAALEDGDSDDGEDLEALLDEMFILDDKPPPPPPARIPAPRAGGTDPRALGLKLGEAGPRLPPPPPTGPHRAVPPDPGSKKRGP